MASILQRFTGNGKESNNNPARDPPRPRRLAAMTQPLHSSLRTRLLLNLLPLVVMFLLMGLCAITLFSRLAVRVDATVKENYRSIMAIQAINSLLDNWVRGQIPAGAGGSSSSTNALAEYSRQLEENLALLAKPRPLPGEEELVRQLSSNYQDLRDAISASMRARAPGAHAQLGDTGIVLLISDMRGELGKIRGLNYEAILSANHDIQNAARQASRWLTVGLAVVVAFSIYSCYRIGRSILRPIQALTNATRELGDGNLKEPVPVLTHDELGALAVAFNKMAGLLQEYRRCTTAEIVRLHRTMEATLASFPDPVFVLNKQGEIELRNPAATTLSANLQLENHLPVRLQTLARSALQSGRNFLPHDFAEGITFPYEGAERFFLPRVLIMQDREGALFGVAVVLQDMTRFRLLDSAKTNLVATVSHELKSPLTSVRMGLHLLLEKTLGGLTPKQEELLQAARDDSERLLRILNDLLDLARLEEGAAGLRREKVAPVELLQSMREAMAGSASAKGVTINCLVDAQLPAVSVDRQRMDHVFTNLISNAIKHSPEGGEIVLRAARTEAGSVEFSVTDHGEGIPEQYQARVFDRFFRVPGQDKNGAGLGLPIAREITVAHGGRIGVKSAPGEGSTFFVVLKSGG